MSVADLEIIYRAPADLTAYARNARTHSEEQIAQIEASISEYGFTNPILLKDDDRTIGAGHGRHIAALNLGLEQVPTITLHGLTDAQWRAYVLADNKIAMNAGWDPGMLRAELADLRGLSFNLALTGFGEMELGDIFAPPAQQDPGPPPPTLMDRFGVAPFSVLNAREGWWQDRKRQWLSLGIKSELGRGENALGFSDTILDPDGSKRRAAANKSGSFADNDKLRAIQTGGRKGNGVPSNLKLGGGGLSAQVGGGKARHESTSIPGALTVGITAHAYGQNAKNKARRAEKTQNIVAGNGWANGGPARRDPAFYQKKRAWEEANGCKISTKDFREKHWDGAA